MPPQNPELQAWVRRVQPVHLSDQAVQLERHQAAGHQAVQQEQQLGEAGVLHAAKEQPVWWAWGVRTGPGSGLGMGVGTGPGSGLGMGVRTGPWSGLVSALIV